jgi:DNA-directed RNA polymerase specialized sigma subunit
MRLFAIISLLFTKSLVYNNVNLVHHFAKKYRITHRLNVDEYNDLVQDGTLGLIRAAEKYDDTRGVKFSTYSSYWIKTYLTKHIKKYYRHATVPLNDKLITGCHYDVYPQINLDLLSSEEQTIIYYRYTRCMSFREIAKNIGVSQMTASNRHKKIIEKLKKQC